MSIRNWKLQESPGVNPRVEVTVLQHCCRGQGEPRVHEGSDVSLGRKTIQSYPDAGALRVRRLSEGPTQPQLILEGLGCRFPGNWLSWSSLQPGCLQILMVPEK